MHNLYKIKVELKGTTFFMGFPGGTVNFQMFKLDLEKAEKAEIKLPTSSRSSKKQKNFRKTSTFALLTTPNL